MSKSVMPMPRFEHPGREKVVWIREVSRRQCAIVAKDEEAELNPGNDAKDAKDADHKNDVKDLSLIHI